MTRRSYFGKLATGAVPLALPAHANAQESTNTQHTGARLDLFSKVNNIGDQAIIVNNEPRSPETHPSSQSG
jgi:hypothetical protein